MTIARWRPPKADEGGLLQGLPRPWIGGAGFTANAVGLAGLLALLTGLGFMLGASALLTLNEAVGLALFAVAVNLLIGYGGLVSFGQAAFYGLGAYTVALGWQHYHWSFWVGFAVAPVLGGLAALVIGLIALRARFLYFALLTLAFSQLFYEVAENQYHYTDGANGVFGAMLPSSLAQPRTGFFFVLAVTAVCLAILWKVTASPFGLTLRSIRENRQRAEALGVNVFRHELIAFVISGIFCALAGTLFVVYSQSSYPELLDWTQSGYAVFMVVIGGMFTFLGPALGAVIYTVGQQYLVAHTSHWQLVLGAVLVLIALLRPDGLAGLLGLAARKLTALASFGRLRRPGPACRDGASDDAGTEPR
jgi:branched-chain amino acid transport system permease protein